MQIETTTTLLICDERGCGRREIFLGKFTDLQRGNMLGGWESAAYLYQGAGLSIHGLFCELHAAPAKLRAKQIYEAADLWPEVDNEEIRASLPAAWLVK